MNTNQALKKLKLKFCREIIFGVGIIAFIDLFIVFFLTSPGKGGFHKPFVSDTDSLQLMFIIIIGCFLFLSLIFSVWTIIEFQRNKTKKIKEIKKIVKYESSGLF